MGSLDAAAEGADDKSAAASMENKLQSVSEPPTISSKAVEIGSESAIDSSIEIPKNLITIQPSKTLEEKRSAHKRTSSGISSNSGH